MLAWIRRRLGWSRDQAPPRPATFRYHNGLEWVERDPWELTTSYNRAGELITAINADFLYGDFAAKREACEEVAAIVRSIFDIPPFEVGGLPTLGVLALSQRFAEFLADDQTRRLKEAGAYCG